MNSILKIRRLIVPFSVLSTAWLATGCAGDAASSHGHGSSGASNAVAVTGVVYASGKPIQNVIVSFYGPGNVPAFGLTGADGHFQVVDSNGNPTLRPGEYEVAVQFSDDTRLLKKYSQYETSGLRVTIGPVAQQLRFDLDTERGAPVTEPAKLVAMRGASLRLPLIPPPGTPVQSTDISDDAEVIGVAIGDEARAYPLGIFRTNEMLVDKLDDSPFVVTWCSLCEAGAAFERIVDGVEMEMYCGAYLWRNNMVILAAVPSDDLTKSTISLWCQLTGEELNMNGTPGKRRLKRVADSERSTLGAWRRRHPNTTVCVVGDAKQAQTYPGRTRESFMDFPPARNDARLKSATHVIGVQLDRRAKAYVVSDVARVKGLEDHMGDQRVVVVHDPRTLLTSALRVPPELGETVFVLSDQGLVDGQGFRWDARTGRCLNGTPGYSLEPLAATRTNWATWADFFPATEIWLPDQ